MGRRARRRRELAVESSGFRVPLELAWEAELVALEVRTAAGPAFPWRVALELAAPVAPEVSPRRNAITHRKPMPSRHS